jgi:uncharacterized membrane protein YphA (DoxX/SURF4 family)
MNTALWIIQIILGIKLLSVSFSHGLRQSQPSMRESIQKMGGHAESLHYGIAICTLIGTIGLLLPGMLRSAAWLTSATAILLSILLLASIFFHVKSREKPNIFVSLILFVFAAFIAYGRWVLTP